MRDARPLLFVGNKRSGTSLMVRLLNLHPDVAVTPESDVIWLLHQLEQGAETIHRYVWDGPVGLERTLAICGPLIRANSDLPPSRRIPDLFHRIQAEVLLHTRAAAHGHLDDLLWIGDKKPVQHCDPALQPFLRTHFRDACFLHMVRHPAQVVASKMKAARSWPSGVPPYWHGSPSDILERWTLQEEWAFDLSRRAGIRLHTVRLENLTVRPAEVMRDVFQFLDVPLSLVAADSIRAIVRAESQTRHASDTLDCTERTKDVMARLGYHGSA